MTYDGGFFNELPTRSVICKRFAWKKGVREEIPWQRSAKWNQRSQDAKQTHGLMMAASELTTHTRLNDRIGNDGYARLMIAFSLMRKKTLIGIGHTSRSKETERNRCLTFEPANEEWSGCLSLGNPFFVYCFTFNTPERYALRSTSVVHGSSTEGSS